MTPNNLLNYGVLLNACSASVAISQHSGPLRSECAEACALGSVQHHAHWLSESLFFFFFAVSHKAAGMVKSPQPQVRRPEFSLGPTINCWECSSNLTILSSNFLIYKEKDIDSFQTVLGISNTWWDSLKTHWLRSHPAENSDLEWG